VLPARVSDWPEDVLELAHERACLIWEGEHRCDPARWDDARRAAVECVRRSVEGYGHRMRDAT
jgi:hypothetical protein